MGSKRQKALWAAVILFLCGVACASTQRRDIESDLIAAMEANCKSVEIKEGREVYIIDPTQKLSVSGCPMALMRGWRDGRMIMEKEVEICACRSWHNR